MLINIFSLRRSGQHAIIFWLLDNIGNITENNSTYMYWNEEKKIYYYNDCTDNIYEYKLDYNYLFKNFEDCKVNIITIDNEIPNKKILIIRDFVNSYCSRINKNIGSIKIREVIEIWKEHISYLNDESFTVIIYNKWISDKEYRDKICDDLSIINKENIEFVPDIGGGSSFNDKNYLERYKMTKIKDEDRNIISNDLELLRLNKEIFNCDIISMFN